MRNIHILKSARLFGIKYAKRLFHYFYYIFETSYSVRIRIKLVKLSEKLRSDTRNTSYIELTIYPT